MERARVPELSGLTRSRAHPGVFWAHGDSNNPAVLYALDARGKTLARVEVKGASHRDWEDIALDDQGNLYVGDIGNNDSERDDLAIHVLREPDPSRDGRVEPVRTLRIRYPDQLGTEQRKKRTQSWNAEAMFVLGTQLYLLTKPLAGPFTALYRVPLEAPSDSVLLERVGEFSVHVRKKQKTGLVTAAAPSPDERSVAVLTYDDVFLFRVAGAHVLEGPAFRADAPDVDGLEAMAWDERGLLLGSEDGRLIRVPVPSEPFTPRR